MKTKLFISILIITIITSCGDPSPTELIMDDTAVDENYDVEIVSPDPEEIDYLSGYDSTGILEPVPEFSSIVSVSGIKNTFDKITTEGGIALAVFYDKSKPVRNSNGLLIGYKSRALGNVSFNNQPARLAENHKKMRGQGGGMKDTVLGFQHFYSFGGGRHHQQQGFPYSTQVQFKLEPFIGQSVEFAIPTPPALNASVNISGSRNARNLEIQLHWQKELNGGIEIIIGGRQKNDGRIFPIFRIRTADDGEFVIPQRLMNEIDQSKFDHLVYSLIRRYKQNFNNQLNDSYIVSQSIHNIGVPVQ